ncbi:GntR family transcriptional regulator [Leucobacter tardus]|uniref:GntR family transcriptional regulator n=1 Tax=Leucobacter tardus TaxID=501483 RepID=A0A939QGX1_9MICO|nr:GntR family transcriptional regulator [Leucobacter tardus]MBO2991023.1 GntR family transcriptional regulator [Leucobacter tardus]
MTQPADDAVAAPLGRSRAEETAAALRALIADAELTPGMRLAEVDLARTHAVSRNTLREAFRILSEQSLVVQVPHRGAFVATPSVMSIIDIYHVRRMIECGALRTALPKHPGVTRMREAVDTALAARESGDWRTVGTANILFHSAIIELADSPRLARFADALAAEVRLAFGLVDDPEYLHAPFIDQNARIVELVAAGSADEAAEALEGYLHRAERVLVTAYERASAARA